MTDMPKLMLNRDECVGGFFLTDGALPATSLHSQVQEVDVPREWLAAHDAEVAANALRRFASERYDAYLEQPDVYYLDQPSELSRRYAKAAQDLRVAADRIEREAATR